MDVVVPFVGSPDELDELKRRLAVLRLRAGDTLTVVDNAGGAPEATVTATEIASSYFARNRGAANGSAPWIVFLDDDVEPAPDLLDAYFAPAPGDATGLLAGGIVDEPAAAGSGVAVRYAALKRLMSHETVLGRGAWSFARTANCAVRRSAFEAVGGFCEVLRSGGDAHLAFGLREAGWSLEVRARASVVHRNRDTVARLLRQSAKHGSGAAWLHEHHPGAFPPRRKLGLARWSLLRWAAGLRAVARGDGDAALEAALDPPAVWAFELGRLVPNHAVRR